MGSYHSPIVCIVVKSGEKHGYGVNAAVFQDRMVVFMLGGYGVEKVGEVVKSMVEDGSFLEVGEGGA